MTFRPFNISGSVLTIAAVTTATCLAIGLYRKNTKIQVIARAKGRKNSRDQVYPPDVFAGARDVVTPYGTIKVFEWGPVNGEKVLIMQGIGTPSLGYAGLAHELVANGYRVMTYGKRISNFSHVPDI
jgi:hypothetical protein